MIKIILFVCIIFIAYSHAWSWSIPGCPPTGDTSCSFTRKQGLDCIMDNADYDNDKRVSQKEIERAEKDYIPMFCRGLAKILHLDMTRILDDCDYNRDGYITPRDWEMTKSTCLPRKQDMCMFKWVCDRAYKKNNKKN